MAFSRRIGPVAAGLLALFAGLAAHQAFAQDFSDPADVLTYQHKQKAGHASLPEIDATIESTSTAKPGWYALNLKLDNGKALKVIVVPATRFYRDYAPLDSAAAYPLLVQGCKIRALHDPDQDLVLHNIVVTDLMFSSPPVEWAGTLKGVVSLQPGVYDLTVTLNKGGEHHLNVDGLTKFWKNNQPLEQKQAYPQLNVGAKVRALETAAPGGLHRVSDLMLVDS